MNIPKAPPVKKSTEITCKIILKDEEAHCITRNELKQLEDNLYLIPSMNIIIDKMSAQIFTQSDAKSFVAIPRRNKQYSLRPLRQGETKSTPEYKEPVMAAEGAYGKIKIYPTEGIAVKYSKRENEKGVPDDIVKEIAIYRLLAEISCLPKLFGFDIDKGIKINFELGSSTLTPLIYSLTDEQKPIIMFRLLKCMRSAASQGLIHGDLKPDNAIISRNGNIQIIDWGIAEIDRTKGQTLSKSTQLQTLPWRAPEILLATIAGKHIGKYTNKIDIYSLGIIFYQILVGYMLTVEYNDITQYNSIVDNLLGSDYKKPKNDINDSVCSIIRKRLLTKDIFLTQNNQFITEEQADLLSHMLEINPEYRWDYDKLILHPVFQTIKRENIPKQPIFINNFFVNDIRTIWNTQEAMNMRSSLFKWLLNACLISRYSLSTLCTSWQIVDIYTSIKQHRKNLQLIGCAALLIAAKIPALYIIPIPNLAKMSGNVFREEDIIDMEKDILTTLEGNILVPNIYDYQSHYHGVKEPPISKQQFWNNYLQLYEDPQVYSGKYYTKEKIKILSEQKEEDIIILSNLTGRSPEYFKDWSAKELQQRIDYEQSEQAQKDENIIILSNLTSHSPEYFKDWSVKELQQRIESEQID